MKRTAAMVAISLILGVSVATTAMAPLAPAAAQSPRGVEADEDAPAPRPRPRRTPSNVNAGPCPLMGVLYDSHRLVDLTSPEERIANVAWTGEIRGVRGLCRYRGDDPIVMNLELDMAFGRGPAAQGDTHTYRYWVAVTRRDAAPIARQVFERTVKFERGSDRISGVEEVERIVIPRANADTSGENFEILVGFELTPEQLAFNRDGKRFRIDAGQQ